MGYVFTKSDGKKLIIGDKVFWEGLNNNGESLERLLDEVAKEPKGKDKDSMLGWIDQMSFQDDRAWFYPFRSGGASTTSGTKEYLQNPVALRMFKMLRTFFKEQKYKPYFLDRVGVKVVQEHITGKPKRSAKEIKEENFKLAAAKLQAKEKMPRKTIKEITKKLNEIALSNKR
jgi:hypothetical protein